MVSNLQPCECCLQKLKELDNRRAAELSAFEEVCPFYSPHFAINLTVFLSFCLSPLGPYRVGPDVFDAVNKHFCFVYA